MRLLRRVCGGMFILGIFAQFASITSGVLQDVWYRDEFVPDTRARILEAQCTTWNAVMLNDCRVRFIPAGASAARELKFSRFGPATERRVALLHARNAPNVYTTDVGLASLENRASVGAVWLALAACIVLGFAFDILLRRAARASA